MKYNVIIPAAGEGTRLRPLSTNVSKAMVPVNKKPCIQYILDKLDDAEQIVIVDGKFDDIRNYVKDIPNVDCVKQEKPAFAVVDLRLGDGNGLEVVKEIQNSNSKSRVVMLTGYGNIPTAVAAIKQGAIDYLSKPADADDVERALLADPNKKAAPPENPMSADRVKWEHIHRVFELCNRNVSETARRLKMHRRTLQRILSKRSPK